MMTGRVTANHQAVVEITLRDAQGQIEVSEAIVDTGFNGFLTLPLPQIARLKFPYEGATDVVLEPVHDLFNKRARKARTAI